MLSLIDCLWAWKMSDETLRSFPGETLGRARQRHRWRPWSQDVPGRYANAATLRRLVMCPSWMPTELIERLVSRPDIPPPTIAIFSLFSCAIKEALFFSLHIDNAIRPVSLRLLLL